MSSVRIIDVTARDGRVTEPAWLTRAERTHRQLRPQIPSDYSAAMGRVFSQGGRLVVAVVAEAVVGVAVWRGYGNTFSGRFLYVDDLLTDEQHRSAGVGGALLAHCETIARELGGSTVTLDSGVQRARAHKFFFRAGYSIAAYSFSKPL